MSRPHGRRHWSRRRTIVYLMAAAVFCAAALAGVYALGRWYENRGYTQQRQQMSEGFGQLRTVQYNGVTYLRRPEVDTLLIIGVDQQDTQMSSSYRGGGQADFLLLMVIDHQNRIVRQLQIDRDAVTDVPVLGVLGNPVGTRLMQISLSHSYGGTEEDRCRNTMQAVANLLGGESAGHCLSVRQDQIGALNSALGGLTVTVPADYSHLDPAMTEGAVLKLNDRQAEILVRARMSMEESTNASRMVRQRTFLSAAMDEIRARLKEDAAFINTLFELLDRISGYTDLPRGELLGEVNQAYTYDILPAETLTGEYTHGSDGFTEFHADEDAVAAWVLDALYEPRN